MSESQHHHHYDAEVAAHDAQGNVKLRLEADDHLSRLLAPDTEIPWYKSIIENVRELIQPEKLPPLELTSKPVAVKDIWGEGTNPKRVAASVIGHVAIFALLIAIGTNDKVQKAIKNVVLIAPGADQADGSQAEPGWRRWFPLSPASGEGPASQTGSQAVCSTSGHH